MSGAIRVSHETVAIAATQDITFSGFGDPAGALFYWNQAEAADVWENDLNMGMGAVSFAGTDKAWSAMNKSINAADPSDCEAYAAEDVSLSFLDPGTSTIAFEGTVTAITDGIRITWSTTPVTGEAYRFMGILFGGGAIVEAGTTIDNTDAFNVTHTVTLTDMAVEPEITFIGNPWTNSFASGFTADSTMGWGWGDSFTGTSPVHQGSVSYNDDDARGAANRHGAYVSTSPADSTGSSPSISLMAYYGGGGQLGGWELDSTGVTGTPLGQFTLQKQITSATISYGYFCVSFEGDLQIHVSVEAYDTNATGSKAITTPGFKPQFLLVAPTRLDATGNNTGANGDPTPGISAIDATGLSEGCYHSGCDEVDGGNTFSRFSANFLDVSASPGGLLFNSLSYQASFTSFDATGYTFNVGTASGGNDRFVVTLCIEEEAAVVLDPSAFLRPPINTPLRM